MSGRCPGCHITEVGYKQDADTVRTVSKQLKGFEFVVREVGHLEDRQD